MELPYLKFAEEAEAKAWIERWADSKVLKCSAPTTLRAYPGCLHWHFSREGMRGVLELTWWPKGEKFWFKVAANRDADWITEILENPGF